MGILTISAKKQALTLRNFTFWISLFTQSKIRTERKFNQKVKSIFLFGLSPIFGLRPKLGGQISIWTEQKDSAKD